MDISSVRTRNKLIFGLSAVVLWIIALFLPAYSDGTPGIACFLFGWTMAFDGHSFALIAWLGNLPFCIALILLLVAKRWSRIVSATLLGALAFLLSFGALTITEITNGETGAVNEAHATAGAYLWMLSLFLVFAGALLTMKNGFEN